jgi:hypothetical protein
MEKNYNINNALNYAEALDKMNSLDKFDYVSFNKAMKFFAENDDKNNFKKIVDKYLLLVETSSKEKIKKNNLSFLEFLCSGMDNGFTNTWYCKQTNEELELGKTQKLLKEMYLTE